MRKDRGITRIGSDPWLLGVTILLCLFGVVMIYSATHNMAYDKFHDPLFYLKKHLFSLFIGGAGLYACSYIPLQRMRQFTFPLLLLVFALLVLLHIPGFGVRAGGALRWLKIGSFRVGQPSELAKLAMVLYLAHSLERKQNVLHQFWYGYVPHIVVAGGIVVLLMAQPDFGTSMMILTLTVAVLFVAGIPFRYLAGSAILALPAVYMLLVSSPYRWRRITAFLNPFAKDNIQGDAYQLVQSLKAFSSGGLTGMGLGFGKQKLGFLPEAHTDFIFAVLGEELGLIGVYVFMGLILILLYRGFTIASRCPNLFGRYLAFGLTCMIGIQSLINLGVVMGSLPTKGMPLPFLSFARTSLIVMLMAVGILLQIEYNTRMMVFNHGKTQHG
ncbi:MAG: putative lipid II flippase FtsW [Deltaproteobacteria bacterium]|nr:MAG: putative lipid II flippase FtsW [Deltaproteobacteria bacterium]